MSPQANARACAPADVAFLRPMTLAPRCLSRYHDNRLGRCLLALIANKGRQDHESPSGTYAGHDRWSLIGATAVTHPNAQSTSGFEKRNFSYNEWTKGKFSEVVTVTNPGKFIFLAGIGPEREGDGKIVHEGDFMEQCRYAYMKIKKLLDLQGATMDDVVRIMTYTTDVRFFQDALKCRGEAFGNAPNSCFDIPGGQPVGVAKHGNRS